MAQQNSYHIELQPRSRRGGASAEALEDFERETGVKIPPDYRRFLMAQNGGPPVRRNFAYGPGPYQDSVLRHFLGVGCPRSYDVRHFLKVYEARLPAKTFPIAADEFDNLVLISRERGAANKILFWDHERELTGNPLSPIAENLEEFLSVLTPDVFRECEIATITFADGETCRQVLPSRYQLKDSGKVIEIPDLKPGDRVNDFGEVKTIVRIEFSREQMRM